MKTTLTEENYLKALFHLVDNEGKVTINELSKFLNVKMPSVNNMMKKFAEKKWVIYETYKPLIVTENGRREAALVVRKHRLTEMFLVKKMNFGWENVHEIAEQLEHVHSKIFLIKWMKFWIIQNSIPTESQSRIKMVTLLPRIFRN